MSREIAEQRIRRLFQLAEKRFDEGNESLADRYVEIAREIGKSYNVPIPSDLRKKFCSDCGVYLKPGSNCDVKINSEKGTVNYRCKRCDNIERYGY